MQTHESGQPQSNTHTHYYYYDYYDYYSPTHPVESMALVFEAGGQVCVDLQAVVVGSQLEGQSRVALLLKTPVGIQHLDTQGSQRQTACLLQLTSTHTLFSWQCIHGAFRMISGFNKAFHMRAI